MMDFEFSSRAGPDDALFLERLDNLMEKHLADIKAFSDREFRPLEETRRRVAECHAKYLFLPTIFTQDTFQDMAAEARTVLCNVSTILESLYEVAGVQSFVLAVNPLDPSDNGFLGGSAGGREFWRSMRTGGESGAKTFKAQCIRQLESLLQPLPHTNTPPSRSNSVAPPKLAARSLKQNLYDAARNALRAVSGVRNAEMKWTQHDRLDAYGVRLVGWPTDIPALNPSTLKSFQNKTILDGMENGTIRFEKLHPEANIPDRIMNISSEGVPSSLEVPAPQDVPTSQDIPTPPEVSTPPESEVQTPQEVPTMDGTLMTQEEPSTLQQTQDIEDLLWAYDAFGGEAVSSDNAMASQELNLTNDIWQPPDDSFFGSSIWTDLDIASLLENTFNNTSSNLTAIDNYPSRKRPRTATDLDDDIPIS